MSGLLGLDMLEAGDENYQHFIPDEEPEEPDYKNGVPFARDVATGRVVRMELDEETRIGLFGISGSGKTTMAKALISRALKHDFKCFHGSDVKNDFQKIDSYGGVSQKMINETEGILPGEKPFEASKTIAIPDFMVDDYRADRSSIRSWAEIFSIGFPDITRDDFKQLINYEGLSDSQKELVDQLLNQIEIKETNWDYLLNRLEEFDSRSVTRVRRVFKNLRQSRVLGNRYRKDLVKRLNEDDVVSLGLKNWENYLGSEIHRVRFYSGILHRNLYQGLRDGEVSGPLILFDDEAHALMPDGEASLVKKHYQNILDVAGRQNQISTMVSSQRPSQLPRPGTDDRYDFIGVLTDVVILRGRNILPEEEWKPVIRQLGVYDGRGGEQLDKWREKFNSLSRYEGVYINSERHHGPDDCPVVRSLAPLFHHAG